MNGGDVGRMLIRALERSADLAGLDQRVVADASTAWASATFTGARHVVTLALAGPGVRDWLAALPEAELAVRGHLVADLKLVRSTVAANRATVVIEVLTVEDS